MRVLKKNLRGDEGEIALLPESLDDLWHLQHLISRGDLVFALTHRKVPAIADKARPEKMERKTVRLGVKVEDVEFHMYSNWLRLHGIIKSGMDVGAYHTLNIELGTDLSILKYHWRPDLLARIDEAVAESQRPRVIIALVEEGEATIGVLRQFGVQMAAEIRQGSGKGSGEDTRAGFMRDVAAAIDTTAKDNAEVILAGPGFTKEDLKKVIDSSLPDLAKRIAMDDTVKVLYELTPAQVHAADRLSEAAGVSISQLIGSLIEHAEMYFTPPEVARLIEPACGTGGLIPDALGEYWDDWSDEREDAQVGPP